MKKINFIKMHGIGNDFIVLNQSDLDRESIVLTEEIVKKMCHRNFGIGSDGIVVIDKGDKIKFKYTMYNPDGSQAEMCGNGIRCYMKYLLDNSLTSKTNIDVETGVGILNLDIKEDIVIVDMGTPKLIEELSFGQKRLGDNFKIISLDREFKFFPVSMGNPHSVIFLEEDIKDFKLNKYGKDIESNTKVFPKKVNVEFINIVSETEINMRVYERGAGETLACGTGACASVVAGISAGTLKKNTFIKVNLAGGVLEIKWSGNKDDSVIMKGPAETSFSGEYFID